MKHFSRKACICAVAAATSLSLLPAAAFGAVAQQEASIANEADAIGNVAVKVSGTAVMADEIDTTEAEGALDTAAETAATFTAAVHPSETWVALLAKGGIFDRATQVYFPTWSQDGGHDDLVWYEARHDEDGSWAAAVEISNHATAGVYDVDAYAVVDGQMVGAGSVQFSITAPTAKAALTSTDNGSYVISITDVASPSGIATAQVAAWTASQGQDDVYWHTGTQTDDGWSVIVSANLHNGEDGTYDSHAYITANNGVRALVGEIRVEMYCRNYAYVTGTMGSGARSIFVKNPSSSVVHMAVWSQDGGQDDLMWLPADNVGDLLWKADLDCKNLKHAGQVVAHVYASDEQVGEVEFGISDNDLIPPMYRGMYNRVQGLNSSSQYLIACDTDNCFVGVYQGSMGNWTPIHYFDCTCGAPGSPTRTGIFTIGDQGYSFGTSAYTCYYFSQYSGNYLFHSVLYNAGTFNLKDGRLGMHLSHGCIRLAIENAKWIHDNLPRGTRVLVY